MRILAGDVGGTKTLLAILEKTRGAWTSHAEERFESRRIESFETTVREFVARSGLGVCAASFGVPGPVTHNSAQGTNLAWPVDGDAVAARLKIPRAIVLNDFAAQALGILELEAADLVALNPDAGPADPAAPIAVIGAGTGLGEAIVVRTAHGPAVVSTEGGHADFAPRNEQEIALLRHLIARFGRASNERILSGPGLANVYRFLLDEGRFVEDAETARQIASAEDPAPQISHAAIERGDPLSSASLDLFVAVYGAEAGNMMLRALARGGVYVTGGIAMKILPRLTAGGFLAAFADKGRLSDVVRRVPVHVVRNPRVGLLGAAAEGLRIAHALAERSPRP